MIFSEDQQGNEKRPNTLKVGALVYTLDFKRIHYQCLYNIGQPLTWGNARYTVRSEERMDQPLSA